MLGASERDIEQPALLGARRRRVGVGDRHQAALEPGHEDGVELESLRPVEGQQVDRVAARVGTIALQRRGEVRQEPLEAARTALGVDVLARQAHERVHVLSLLLGVGVGRVLEVGDEPGEASAWCGSRGVAQCVERGADLGAVEEPGVAADAIRDRRSGERLLERSGLRVGAVEDSEAGPGDAGGLDCAQTRGGAIGLGNLRVERGDGGHIAIGAHRIPTRPARTGVGEQRLGRTDDLRRGPVVAIEPDDAPAAELPTEAREQAGLGPGERVDRLVGVADHTEVGTVAEPRPEEPELRRAHVLELVDEEVPEPPSLGCRERSVAFECVGARPEQVVEVDETPRPLLLLVARVDLRDLARRSRRGAIGERDRCAGSTVW